ncbi:MAG: hypothetical protein GVY30_04180 [Chloroflexi bacterium]|jgi:hypothetical protein|nr:hypothetical protein [Chloroflexota bacterium]
MSELSYQEAVHLFEHWGFEVTSGPRAGEVTLILVTPCSRTYAVHPAAMLPRMAEHILAVRWRNGSIACAEEAVEIVIAV